MLKQNERSVHVEQWKAKNIGFLSQQVNYSDIESVEMWLCLACGVISVVSMQIKMNQDFPEVKDVILPNVKILSLASPNIN